MNGPEEGVSRCECGCKYWDDDRCHDCGEYWSGECPAGGQHSFVWRETHDHRMRVGCDECGAEPEKCSERY